MDDQWHGLGLPRERIAHVHVRGEWLDVGARLADDTAATLGIDRARVEHIGSTSVPGLLAKPIIDLAVGLVDDGLADLVRDLTPEGWIYRGDAGDEGGYVFVLEREPDVRVAHLHGVPYEGDQWHRYLALRERLRADPAARERYEQVKVALHGRHGDDRVAYTEGKTPIVRSILDLD